MREIRIEGLAAGGDGIGRLDGKAAFVPLSAPGDLAVVRVEEERPGFIRAEIAELVEPSPDRVEPACPLYGRCGGCSLQHLSYEAQVRHKAAAFREAFSRISGLDAAEVRSVPSEPFGYRNRMQLRRTERPRPGVSPVSLVGRDGASLVPVADCPVADPAVRSALAAGTLRCPVHADRFNVYGRGALLLAEGAIERGRVGILGKELALDVRGFFQSNAGALERLLSDVLDFASAADSGLPAVDLYCGVGTFGAFLADRFERVDFVERDKRTLALARENVRSAGGTRGAKAEFFAISDDDWAKRPARASGEGGYGFAVVDPPRTGLSAALKRWLAAARPARLAYVSCDGGTLARDARELAAAGFELESLSYHDFYPQTGHVEAFAAFRGPS